VQFAARLAFGSHPHATRAAPRLSSTTRGEA
jgi:hypothetical protein